MSNCPFCSNQLVMRTHRREAYWFCRTCWEEIPNQMMSNATHHPPDFKLYLGLEAKLETLIHGTSRQNVSVPDFAGST